MKSLWGIVGLCLHSLSASAALHSRAGGQAYYDDVLNITWLTDANLARTNAFGVSGINGDSNVPGGFMGWNTAQSWILAMNAANYLGTNIWRLPAVADLGPPGCNFAYAGTDCGFNVATGELAHVFSDTLGNSYQVDVNGQATGCSVNPTYCLTNTGPFSNIQAPPPGAGYWYGTVDPNNGYAWEFTFATGQQYTNLKDNYGYVWALRTGDIGVVAFTDADGDGVADAVDNCSAVSNALAGDVPGTSPPVAKYQLDSDDDGFGNRCDADLNNTGAAANVNTTDYSIFRSVINKPYTFSTNAERSDLNGDGTVNTTDYSIFRTLINKVPGPSGYTCAGTIPCP